MRKRETYPKRIFPAAILRLNQEEREKMAMSGVGRPVVRQLEIFIYQE